jgi:hypothetical protein
MKFFKWQIQKLPISERDVPDKWIVGTKHTLFGIDFIVWKLK